MAEFKCTQNNSFYVDANDFNKFIKEFYDTEYDFELSEGNLNDEYPGPRFYITKHTLSPVQETDLNSVKQGFIREYTCGAILTDLCNKDVIKSGEYIFGKDF